MLEFKVLNDEFFTVWLNEVSSIRIMKDKVNKSFYPYSIQKYDGRVWNELKIAHTLKVAKQYCYYVLNKNV